MGGAMSRRKGANGERELAKLLQHVFPEAKRRCSGAESQCDQGRDLDGTPGLCAQVNVSARPPIERKLSEAVNAAKPDELPVAFTRRSSRNGSGEWLATMRLDDLVDLLKDAGYPRKTMPFASPVGSTRPVVLASGRIVEYCPICNAQAWIDEVFQHKDGCPVGQNSDGPPSVESSNK